MQDANNVLKKYISLQRLREQQHKHTDLKSKENEKISILFSIWLQYHSHLAVTKLSQQKKLLIQ